MTPVPASPLDAFLHAMPKVELHCHLFGTVRHDTFAALNRRAGSPLADEEIEGFYTRGEKPVGVLRVLRALDAQLVRMPDDLHRLAFEYLRGRGGPQRALRRVLLEPDGHGARLRHRLPAWRRTRSCGRSTTRSANSASPAG